MRNHLLALLFLAFFTINSPAQKTEWRPKHLEELSVRPHQIPKQLLEVMKSKARTDTDGEACSEPSDFERRSSLKSVRLGPAGRSQVIIQGVGPCQCSPTGNCSFWIYEKSTGSYRLLLEKAGVQVFSIEDARTYGYHDIVTGMHGSAFDTDLTVFEFDRERYQPRECWSMTYPDTVDAKSGRLTGKPIFKKRDCYHSQ